jgi:hypothetical protein
MGDRLDGEDAVGTPAVGDHRTVPGQLGQAALQLCQRDGQRPRKVAGLILLPGPDIQ